MRILFVTPYFPPQNAVASLRTHAFAFHWTQAGDDVTVLTTAKRVDQHGLNLPANGFRVVEIDYAIPLILEKLRRSQKSSANGMEQTCTNSIRPGLIARLKERTGIFSSVRMPDLTDYWVKPAIEWAQQHAEASWDVVVSSSGPYTAHLVGRALKRTGAARSWVTDFRDLWTDNHAHCGLPPFVLRERRLERACLREADAIVTATDGLAARLRGKSQRDVEVIYNGFDEVVESALGARVLPADDRIRIVYTGTVYSAGQDVVPLLEALARLQREQPQAAEKIRLVVAGKGQAEWKQAADRLGVTAMVELHGMVSRPEALQMQRDADALLLLDWRNCNDGVLTAKVFEYLSAHAPVLVLGPHRDSEALRLVERSRRGWYGGSDETQIAKTLSAFYRDRESFTSKPNKAVIAQFSREHQSLRLLQLLRQVMLTPRASETSGVKSQCPL
jgi:hypothetical protein